MNIRPDETYVSQLKEKHRREPGFGTRSECPLMLEKFIEQNPLRQAVDFGCGKGELVRLLASKFPSLEVSGYDPVFTPEFSWVDNIDLIFSTDVLEHIEPESLPRTVSFLESKALYHYHLIACHKARAILPNGDNAHLIVQPPDWWQSFFYERGVHVIDENATAFIKRRSGYLPLAVTHYEILYRTTV